MNSLAYAYVTLHDRESCILTCFGNCRSSCTSLYEPVDKRNRPPPPLFYTKNGPFHLIKSHPVVPVLQKNIKIPQSLWTCIDIIIYMWQALLVNTYSAILGIMMVAKRYHRFCMSVLYKRYIATTSKDNPKPSTIAGEGENSHNSHLESFNSCLHYSLVSLNLYHFGMGYECLKLATFGVKRGGVSFFCRQDRTSIAPWQKSSLLAPFTPKTTHQNSITYSADWSILGEIVFLSILNRSL